MLLFELEHSAKEKKKETLTFSFNILAEVVFFSPQNLKNRNVF